MSYNYQIEAAKQVLSNALNSKYLASVLAASPGSGKTTISHIIINDYLSKFPNSKVLVLTHGQNSLKNQYLNDLNNPNVGIRFSYGDFQSNSQVRVGIPQSIKNMDWNSVDLLIIDEAHAFYGMSTVNKIIKDKSPKHVILMTGSPSKFNKHNENKKNKPYGMYYISVESLIQNDVFSSVYMDVSMKEDISDVINDSHNKGYDVRKVMIAVSSIQEANFISGRIKNAMISTSESDADGEIIDSFKKVRSGTLVVVNRGVLGFNDPTITCLIDMRSSSDLEISYQLFARVLRKHPDRLKKSYIRVCKSEYNKEVLMLHKIKSFMQHKIFSMYNGKNLVRVS